MAVPNANSNSSDWTHSYTDQTNFSSLTQVEAPPTNIIATSSSRNNNIPTDQARRVSKPLNRRSRASRRTPTTLLNTDAANFRAMVQHFTGGPSMSRDFNFVGEAASRSHLQYDPNQALMQQEQMFVINNMHGGVSTQTPPGSNGGRNLDHYICFDR